jgi:hypothetical protein
MVKAVSEKGVYVLFNSNGEPQYEFKGAWGIRDLGRVRGTLFQAYKHYIRELRLKEEKK